MILFFNNNINYTENDLDKLLIKFFKIDKYNIYEK